MCFLIGVAGCTAPVQAGEAEALRIEKKIRGRMVTVAISGRNAQLDERTPRLREAWRTRSDRDFWTDLRPVYPSCHGDDNQSCTVVGVDQRVATDFLWQRSPFQLWGGWLGTTESAGIDYILPYWMGRYYGVITERRGPPSRPDRQPGRLVSQ